MNNLAQYNSIKKQYGSTNAINHMIRTPITCILGFNQLLSKTDLNIEQKKYVENITKSARQLLLVIDNLIAETQYGNKKKNINSRR